MTSAFPGVFKEESLQNETEKESQGAKAS